MSVKKVRNPCLHNVTKQACITCSPFHCEYCDITIPISRKFNHISTRKHQYKVNPELKPKKTKKVRKAKTKKAKPEPKPKPEAKPKNKKKINRPENDIIIIDTDSTYRMVNNEIVCYYNFSKY